MASKKSLLGKVFAFSLFAAFSMSANAQIKYNLVVTDNEGKKLINYTELIPVLINAVQQLSSEVEELKGKISK